MGSIRNMNSHKFASDSVSNLSAKYAGKNSEELMQELFRSVSESKLNGTFSAARLDEFVAFVTPNLDEASRRRLNELVAMIKNGG